MDVQEAEIAEALRQYGTSLADIEQLLATDATNVDLIQTAAELREAMEGCQDMLQQLATQVSAGVPAGDTQPQAALMPSICGNANAPQDSSAETATPARPSAQPARCGTSLLSGAPLGDSSAEILPIGPRLPGGASPGAQQGAIDAAAAGKQRRAHPMSCYADAEPDFLALAREHPAFAAHVRAGSDGRGHVDFTNVDAARELTRALLAKDFGIEWGLAEGQLIPPVTNRANYIHWLHDLLSLLPPQRRSGVRVLDVGCGASLIYPLLGAVLHGWAFVGVDVTDAALAGAAANRRANPRLAPLIEVRRSASSGSADTGILTPAVRPDERFTFTMCNPPFFSDVDEAGRNPGTAFSGTDAEMVTPGGELAFVAQMVDDSISLQGRVEWFTSMLGKKATLRVLRRLLAARGVRAVRTTEFRQGRTSRWGLAWAIGAGPIAATQALPRGLGAASAVPGGRTRRQASFSLKGSTAKSAAVLAVLEGLLAARGAATTVDAALFTLAAHVPLPAADSADVVRDPPNGGSRGSQALRRDVQRHAKRQRVTAQDPNPKASAHEPNSRNGQKNARPGLEPGGVDADGEANVQQSSASRAACNNEMYALRLCVRQEAHGQLAVTATVRTDSSDAVAHHMVAVMAELANDTHQILLTL